MVHRHRHTAATACASHPGARRAYPPYLRPRTLTLAVGLVFAAAALPPAVWAQTATALPSGEDTRVFDISAGPLRPALDRFARAAGVNLSYDAAQVDNARTQGVNGRQGIAAALRTLLAGTGLQAVAQPGSGYSLRRAASATGTANPAPAAAAPAGGGANAALPEVKVTSSALRDGVTEGTDSYTTPATTAATGLNLSLRETPQSVTVITRQRMDDQALDSLGMVVDQTPGITQTAYGPAATGGNRAPLYARGFMANTFQVDGVTMPSGALSTGAGWDGNGSIDMAIYDSVTIVRGATGLLAGSGDPSATISLTRKRPTDTFQASVAQSMGRWSQRRSVADLGGPLNATGSLRGRLVAVYDEGGSWLERAQHYKRLAYGVLEADLGRTTLLRFAVEHGQESAHDIVPNSGFMPDFSDGSRAPFTGRDNAALDWSEWHSRRTSFTTALEHRFNDDWQASLSYIHSRFNADSKTSLMGGGWMVPEPDGMSTIMLYKTRVANRVNTFDAKLNGRYALWGRQHELVAGFNTSDANLGLPDYRRTARDYCCVQVLGWNGSGYPEPDWSAYASEASTTVTRQTDMYAATRLRTTDDLSFILGARWSHWSTKTRDLVTGTLTDDRKEKGVLTPYLGVTYDFTQNLSAYASYTTIFKPQANRDVQGRPLDPETGKNLEVGVKGEWLDGRLNASAAVFQVKKDNLPVEDGNQLTPTGETAYRAEDNTKGHGWELEVAGEPLPGWRIQGGYTRMQTKDSGGARLNTDQPKHLFKLFTTWTPARLRQLTVGGGVLWQSAIFDEGLGDLYRQKSYAVVNLMAKYAFNRHLSLAVNVGNVLNQHYRTSTGNLNYGAPRHINATLKYQF